MWFEKCAVVESAEGMDMSELLSLWPCRIKNVVYVYHEMYSFKGYKVVVSLIIFFKLPPRALRQPPGLRQMSS